MRPIYKLTFIVLLAIQFCSQASERFILRGVILDTIFSGSDSLFLELLEEGSVHRIPFGEPFEIALPEDDSWNVCIGNESEEHCYEISQAVAQDTAVTDTLGDGNRIEVFTSFLQAISSPKAQDDSFDSFTEDSLISDIEVETPELLTRLRPVVIQVRRRPARSLGQSTVTAGAIARQPGLAEADVIKAIQALPGVVSSSDFSSKIYVRGGGADQNLFLFDNGVVYSPVHFFGLFSTFLVEGIESVDFYKGGFSPYYGNRLSSVVDIKSRKGGNDEEQFNLGGSLQTSTFATTLTLEGSRGGTRVLLSGRSTYIKEVLSFLRSVGLTNIDIDYRFYDLQGNIFQQLRPDEGLMLSFYTGRDNLALSPLETFWGNTVIPLNYYRRIGDDLKLNATLSYSAFDQEFGIENIQTFTNSVQSAAAKGSLSYECIQNHELTLGFESQLFSTSFGNRADFIDLSNEAEDQFGLHSLFVEDNISWERLQLKSGIRFNYLTSLKEFSAEPRVSLRIPLNSQQRIDFHSGYYRQFINSVIFGDFEPINEFYYPAKKETTQDVPSSSSILFAAGYTNDSLFNRISLILEGYFKTLDGLIVFAPSEKPDSIRNDPRANLGDLFITGEGYSMGAEVTLRAEERSFYGGASYALGYSVQKEGSQVFRAKWDITHSLKIDGGINWRDTETSGIWPGKRTFLRSSFQFAYTTGAPYTEITGYLPTHYINQGDGQLPGGPTPALGGNLATPLGGRNNSRYPPYARFDIKVIDWGRPGVWDFSWTLLNIFNRENIFFYTYDNSVKPPERTAIAQFPFFPILFSFKRYF